MIPRINLLTLDDPVRPPSGIVYSTSPQKAEGENEVSYFTKGPALEIVFAELAGCTLATEVGLVVPDVAACVWSEEVLAGSADVKFDRDASHWLGRRERVVNFGDLFDAIVADIWLANEDRNMGNVLARSAIGRQVEFVFIDFEKSATLRPSPIIRSNMLEPRQLWPTSELGQALGAIRPPHPPQHIIQRIRTLSEARCSEIIHDAVEAIGIEVPWEENSIQALMGRAGRIQQLAEEVWRAIR
jgi:hypothetical protein